MENIVKFVGKPKISDIKGLDPYIDYLQKYSCSDKIDWNEHPIFEHVKDKDALDLLEKLLIFNPEKRITCEIALREPYFKEIFNEEDLVEYPKFNPKFETLEKLKESLKSQIKL